MISNWLMLVLFLLFGTGCASDTARTIGLDKISAHAEKELSTGIKNYEDGNYKTAAKNLQGALDAGLTFSSDRTRAHKYLAFIYCTSDREKQCRDEFRKAVETDPKFELGATETGHPIWGPVFRNVKMEMSGRSKK